MGVTRGWRRSYPEMPRGTGCVFECDCQSERYCGGGDRTQLKPVASRIPHNRFQTVFMNVRP